MSPLDWSISHREVLELLQRLLRTDSCNPPGREGPVAELLAGVMEAAGVEVSLMPLAPDRANVLGRWRGTGSKPALLYAGHLDTVPVGGSNWRHDPHGGVTQGDMVYGRGAVDMKGGVAAMVTACIALARSGRRLAGDVIFAGTAGEEVDCVGSRDLLTHDLGPVAAMVVGEPTRLETVTAHKGALWLEITTTGKAAHGAMPEQGYNAIVAMHRLVDRLLAHRPAYREHPLLGSPTLNLGTIQGGAKTNVVPDRCALTVDMRTVPAQNHRTLVGGIQGIIDPLAHGDPMFHGSVQVICDRPPVETSPEEPLVQAALRVGREILGRSLAPKGVSYFTDASVLTPELGVPTLIMGPGDERLAHQVDERIELSAVRSGALFYVGLAEAFLSQ